MSKRTFRLTRRMRKQPEKAQAERERREHRHQLRAQRPLPRYLRILARLLKARSTGPLSQDTEAVYATELNDCHVKMIPREEAQIERLFRQRKKALAPKNRRTE